MMELNDVRRKVKRRFELKNITLRSDALTYIAQNVINKTEKEIEGYINKLVEIFEKEQVEDQVISLEILQKCLRATFGQDSEKDKKFKLINANQWKKMVYDPLMKAYKVDGVLEDQAETTRYNLVCDNASNTALLRVELLYSRTNEAVSVLGALRRHKGTTYAVEDPTGYVKLLFKDVVFDDGLFFEGGIYEFHGVYRNHILNVEKIALPEIKPEVSIKQFRVRSWSSSDCVVIISDVWLNDPAVLRKFHTILSGVDNVYAVILCGDFLSPHVQGSIVQTLTDGLRHVRNIVDEFGDKFDDTAFIFVPSADDYPKIEVAPRLPLAPSIAKSRKNFYFASNPCKLECRDQTFIIYRDNIIQKACRNAVKVPSNVNEIHNRFCETILSQKHYSPLPLHISPMIPRLDYIYHLTPVPDLLILADKYTQYFFQQNTAGTVICNPGSFSKSGFDFAVYYPNSRKIELCNAKI